MAWKVEETADRSFRFGAYVDLGGLREIDFVGVSICDNLAHLVAFSQFCHELFVRKLLATCTEN